MAMTIRDIAWWVDNRDAVTERWNEWILEYPHSMQARADSWAARARSAVWSCCGW